MHLYHICYMSDMGSIRANISDELHRNLRLRALRLDKTLRETIIDLLEAGLRFENEGGPSTYRCSNCGEIVDEFYLTEYENKNLKSPSCPKCGGTRYYQI